MQTVFNGDKSRAYLYQKYIKPIGVPCQVLDIGCGPGHMAGLMPDSVYYTGFDISQAYIDTAKKTFSERDNTKFICAEPNDLLYDKRVLDGSVDAVTIHGVIHHVSDEIGIQIFNLARKKLKIGGVIAILEPVWLDGGSPLRHIVMRLDRGKNIKTVDEWKKFFSTVSSNWASYNIYIEENIVHLYDISICKMEKIKD